MRLSSKGQEHNGGIGEKKNKGEGGASMRDLEKDLEICQTATPGPWVAWKYVPGNWTVSHTDPPNSVDICLMYHNDNAKNNADFIAEAREGWPEAIQRAMAAEARVEELEEEIEALKWQLKEQDNAALRTLEIERDEKHIWKKRAKRGEQNG